MAAGRLATLPCVPSSPARILNRLPTSQRVLRLCLAVLALALMSVTAVSGAAAMDAKSLQSCADAVIADWYDDGRIGKIYPLECYRSALKQLPTDVLDYSNAKEEIGRALAFARQGKPDPGGSDPTPTTATTTSTQPVTTETTKTATTKTDTTPTDTTPTDTTPTDTAETSTTDTSGPSSVPVPLLVLGGLAVLLLAAGSAGYLRRRMSGDSGGDGTPPASV